MMVVTLGQQYNVNEKPTVILYIYIINRHAGAPKAEAKVTMNLNTDTSICFIIGLDRMGVDEGNKFKSWMDVEMIQWKIVR